MGVTKVVAFILEDESANSKQDWVRGTYGPIRGDVGAVGGVSAMGRRKPSDLTAAVLERIARTASACPEEMGRVS